MNVPRGRVLLSLVLPEQELAAGNEDHLRPVFEPDDLLREIADVLRAFPGFPERPGLGRFFVIGFSAALD